MLTLEDNKTSDGMKDSLSTLMDLLKCPLCNELFDKPTTLASCAHSFCVSCIDSYCCNSWVCPVKGCGMPMSITGGHGGSYRKINPQLSQTVESLKLICKGLNRAPDNWWKSPNAMKILAAEQPPSQEGNNDDDDDDDDAEMVDLQQMHPPHNQDEPESSQDLLDSDSNKENDNEWD